MACSENVMKYNNITDLLISAFGEVFSREAIYSIVESCSGDLNDAANAIMSMTIEDNTAQNIIESSPQYIPNAENSDQPTTENAFQGNKNNQVSTPGYSLMNTNTNASHSSLKLSYVEASKSKKKRTTSKQLDNSYQTSPKNNYRNNCIVWTEQIRRIAKYHNDGARNLIIMRGVPGSGKTYLARQIQEMTVGNDPENTHIFSTDDYFMVNNNYVYKREYLGTAHDWNQSRAYKALNMGVSPVIIDNTNIELHEIAPYAKAGINNGYILEIVEPKTHWARDLHQLAHRNRHGVKHFKIGKMLEKMKDSYVSSDFFITTSPYPTHMRPPILRCLPKILPYDIASATREPTKKNEFNNNSCMADSNESISFNMQTNKNYTEIHDKKTTNIKYAVEAGDQFSKELSVAENSKLCNNEINTFQAEMISKTKDNMVLTNATDFNDIKEKKHNILTSEHIQKSESKIISEKIEQINCNTEDTDLYEKGELQRDVNSTKCLKDEVPLTEISRTQDSELGNTGDNINFAKFMEEFEKVEIEWDNGEAWEENTDTSKQMALVPLDSNIQSKLPRTKKTKDNKESVPIDSNNDWRKMYTPMPSYTDNNNFSNIVKSKNVVATKSTETCMEIGDTEISNIKDGFKIVPTVARDINFNYVPPLCNKIPEKRMFDKGSMTNEQNFVLSNNRCRNEEQHFKALQKLFGDVKTQELRHIFDECYGNVNWAVALLLGEDNIENIIQCISPNEKADTEDDEVLNYDNSCTCISCYGILPDITPTTENTEHDIPSTSTGTDFTNIIRSKQKKGQTISDTALSLKRQIERNIVISDQHYSEACLKFRKMRRGECGVTGDFSTSQNIGTGITMDNSNQSELHSSFVNDHNKTSENKISGSSFDVDSEDSDSDSKINKIEKTVNINLGRDFLNQLDMLFGRTDIVYPEKIEPKICMPMTMLVEINALWVQSMMYQLEAQSKSHEEMIKLDEDFARELAMKEIEMSQSGKEPEVPNLNEIMDMEKALALYRKDCEVSMEKDRPTDLAARLSTKKLHDLFPELEPNVLDEILMAHDFNFQNTVAVVLKTQGKNTIIEAENGVNKFIMEQELKRQELFLATEKKRLMDEKWPALPSTLDMKIVEGYRDKAKQYLERKDEYYVSAKDKLEDKYAYQLATNYKTLSELYMLRCEQANYIVAASVVQLEKNKDRSTLDLHYMHMKEALHAVDVFLDSHILRLRQTRERRYDLVFLITGRGLHSLRGPVIKPAVLKRLNARGLHYRESNPGLMAVNVSARDHLTCQIP